MIYNLGSINADHFYGLSHLPKPGETIAAESLSTGLGGKGANMSVACARAGRQVRHIGAVGKNGTWATDRLAGYGVDIDAVRVVDAATGHAIINIDAAGENAIVIHPGANQMQSENHIREVLKDAGPDDVLLLQNETNLGAFCAELGSVIGMTVIYAAAPFEACITQKILPLTDILILNETELAQLLDSENAGVCDLGVKRIIVTRGANGAILYENAEQKRFAAPVVSAVDTTGAGDTFTGYLAAGIDAGLSMDHSIQRAMHAAALMVTKKGTADAIPVLQEVKDFLG
ncbi:MAG: ribokinase [Pseudomonadota bacterium]